MTDEQSPDHGDLKPNSLSWLSWLLRALATTGMVAGVLVVIFFH
jgi:hypothetical protein